MENKEIEDIKQRLDQTQGQLAAYQTLLTVVLSALHAEGPVKDHHLERIKAEIEKGSQKPNELPAARHLSTQSLKVFREQLQALANSRELQSGSNWIDGLSHRI